MGIYEFFGLGIILGISLAVYIYETVKEKQITRSMFFTSRNLRNALEKSTVLISKKMNELKRELTEEEKDAIIKKCYTSE